MAGEFGGKRPSRITESDATVITAEADAPIVPIKEGLDKEHAFQIDLESKDSDSDKTRLYTITNENGEEENISEDDPRISSIPSYVRRVVNLTDDPSESTITFRYFLLTVLFVAPGAFLSQMSHYRTTAAPYSVSNIVLETHGTLLTVLGIFRPDCLELCRKVACTSATGMGNQDTLYQEELQPQPRPFQHEGTRSRYNFGG